eukprot:jgi/Bigna1/62371/fgenesh1_kg.34_\
MCGEQNVYVLLPFYTKVAPLQLAFGKQTAQLGYSSMLAWVPALLSPPRMQSYSNFASSLSHDQALQMLMIVIWNGAISSAFTSYAQSYGQRRIPATLASLLFTTQPLWNALLCSIFLHESIGAIGIGGITLVLAALSNSLLKLSEDSEKSKEI